MSEILRKQYLGEIRAMDHDTQTLTMVISTETKDRDGDIIEAKGWELDPYRTNPVVLFAHDYRSPPVAKTLNIEVKRKKLVAEMQFAPTPFGQELWQLYAGGFMRAASVGFVPKKWVDIEPEEDGSDVQSPLQRGGRRYKQQELLEYSLVPVPSNPDALAQARTAGLDTGFVEKALQEGKDKPGKPTEEWFQELMTAYAKIFDTQAKEANDEVPKDTPEEPEPGPATSSDEVKSVIPYKRTPLAAEDEAWDAAAEVREADVDDLKVMCTWFDSEQPDIKSSYKLPHHKAAGEHSCVWKGVVAAMTALLGGRGGVQLPAGDRKAVYNHLKRHYVDDFDKPVPDFKFAEGNADKYLLLHYDGETAMWAPMPFAPPTMTSDAVPYVPVTESIEVDSVSAQAESGMGERPFNPATIADELDYIKTLLQERTLPEEAKPLAREVIELLSRDTGDETAGADNVEAVLSTEKQNKLRQAAALMEEVLGRSESKVFDATEIGRLIAQSFKEKLGGS